MPSNNIFVYAGQVLWQLLRDLIYFPLWWYSVGLYKRLQWCLVFCADWWRGLALGTWIKYLFVPMYGQNDFAGRLISFLMRSFQIVIRLMAFLFWIMVALGIIVIWLLAPLIIVWQILYQLNFVYAS